MITIVSKDSQKKRITIKNQKGILFNMELQVSIIKIQRLSILGKPK